MANKLRYMIIVVSSKHCVTDELRSMLETRGFYNIVTAETAEEAITKLKSPFSQSNTGTVAMLDTPLLIIDEFLDDMDGFKLSRIIKANHENCLSVLRTDNVDRGLSKRLTEAKIDDFIETTCSPEVAAARVELLVERFDSGEQHGKLSATGAKLDDHRIPHIGDKIDDYFILDSLGWGKSCVVYRVIDTESNAVFALKLLTKHALDSKLAVDNFKSEVAIMSKMRHSNIVRLYAAGEHEGCPYILMDFINGVNLEEFMVSMGQPDLKTFFRMGSEIATALRYTHDSGIVHRDVKLKNIMYAVDSNRCVLTDFGIADLLSKKVGHGHTPISGTPNYMAPELFSGEKASISSDIYAFGVSMYQLLTATPPFVAKTTKALSQKHFGERPMSMRFTRPDIPATLEELIVDRCMAKIPAHRPSAMQEVLDELKSLERAVANVKLSKYRVLLVDDDKNILSALRRLLRKEPYEIFCAESGKEALEILRTMDVALVVSDFKMPKMQGVELAKEICDYSPDTMCMILSGQSEIGEVIEAIDNGYVYKFLPKPWLDEDLKLTVKLALERYELLKKSNCYNGSIL